ncbi:hypothetical protein [Corynebacterium accolens]|uniref:hypothetical protein n=1 Tax=Corynebacterium accolens TaxID=38284 RepID=UPI002542E17B|nr:hypothetical protein [Corynebacterium accolens]MDK4331607.1 hypothetical protein [Corynebacterium accolens]
MKLNKRVLASVALSASLVTTAVTPAAWAADDDYLTCTEDFRAGIEVDAAIYVNVAKHLQRNCNWSVDRISPLNVEQMRQVAKKLKKEDGTLLHSEDALNFLKPTWVLDVVNYNKAFSGNGGMGSAGDGQQSEFPLTVDEVKAGAKEVTGSVFLRPGQKKTIHIAFPNFQVSAADLQFNGSTAQGEDVSKGEVATFKFKVPQGLELKANDEIAVYPTYYDFGKDVPVKVAVKSAGDGDGENPPTPPGDNENPPMPPGDNENPPKPPVPGGDTGESGSDFGSIFGVIAGLAGLAAVVASIAKIFNHGLGILRILQPLRDFLAQFNIKF